MTSGAIQAKLFSVYYFADFTVKSDYDGVIKLTEKPIHCKWQTISSCLSSQTPPHARTQHNSMLYLNSLFTMHINS